MTRPRFGGEPSRIEDRADMAQLAMEYEGQKLTPTYSGTLECSEKTAGTVDVQGMGVGGDFSATRAK